MSRSRRHNPCFQTAGAASNKHFKGYSNATRRNDDRMTLRAVLKGDDDPDSTLMSHRYAYGCDDRDDEKDGRSWYTRHDRFYYSYKLWRK